MTIEQTNKESVEQKTAVSNTIQGGEQQAVNIVDQANKTAERLERANKEALAYVERIEASATRMMLAGRAESGVIHKTPEQMQQEEIDKQVNINLMRFNMKKK